MYTDDTVITAAKRGFKKTTSYPQIRSVIIPPLIYPLIAACPNLESLTTWETPSFFLPALVKGLTAQRQLSCSLLDAIRWFVPILFGANSEAIGEEPPPLQRITIFSDYTRRNDYVGLHFTENFRGVGF